MRQRQRAAVFNKESQEIPPGHHREHGDTVLSYERYPSSRRKGLLVSVNNQIGAGTVSNPAAAFAYIFRRKLRPIRVSDCLVTDKDGTPIAVIRVDPVTGRRIREAVKP